MQCPVFSSAGATWCLKLFLYGQTRFKSEGTVDVVIERLQSHIRKHPVLYEMFVKSDDGKESLLDDYFGNIYPPEVTGFFIFDSDHAEENVIQLTSYDGFLECAGSKPKFGTVAIIIGFRIPKKSEIRMNVQMESVQPVVGEYYVNYFFFF